MGSTYSIAVYGNDRALMEASVDAAFEEVQRLDRMLSNYKPESELSQVNRYAEERPVEVSPELFRLLSACVEYSRESEGAFDITVGPLMKVWGFYKGTGRLPHRADRPLRGEHRGRGMGGSRPGRLPEHSAQTRDMDGEIRRQGCRARPGGNWERLRSGSYGGHFERERHPHGSDFGVRK